MISVLKPNSIEFPPIENAEEDGLLAVGGNLEPETLLKAYKNGIFPWYSEDSQFGYLENLILWWSPNPRFVLFPKKIHISKSMKKILNKKQFKITINKAFPQIISRCKQEVRAKQEGTWITDKMEKAYIELHSLGYAISVEAWHSGTNTLAGGLYGVMIGKAFFGESMFSTTNNASKVAFITFVQILEEAGCPIIDCQVETPHLKTLGAEFITRKEFLKNINSASKQRSVDFDKI